MSELEYVGKRYVREDAYDKARGKNRYTCDRKLTGMLFAKLVLSERHMRVCGSERKKR